MPVNVDENVEQTYVSNECKWCHSPCELLPYRLPANIFKKKLCELANLFDHHQLDLIACELFEL